MDRLKGSENKIDKKIERICYICNKSFRVKPSHIKRGKGKFCSYKCRIIWLSTYCRGKGHPMYGKKHTQESINKMKDAHKGKHHSPATEFKKGIRLSPQTEFKKGHTPWNKGKKSLQKSPRIGTHLPLKIRKKISKTLKGKYTGEKHPMWKGGKAKCIDCGKLLKGYNSKRCRKHSVTGIHNWNWKNGIGNKPYPYGFNNSLKELIRQRDRYKCQLCDTPQVECNTKLPVHHIDYNKNNLKHTNLISLCNGCNIRINANRRHWRKFFENKIRRIYATK